MRCSTAAKPTNGGRNCSRHQSTRNWSSLGGSLCDLSARVFSIEKAVIVLMNIRLPEEWILSSGGLLRVPWSKWLVLAANTYLLLRSLAHDLSEYRKFVQFAEILISKSRLFCRAKKNINIDSLLACQEAEESVNIQAPHDFQYGKNRWHRFTPFLVSYLRDSRIWWCIPDQIVHIDWCCWVDQWFSPKASNLFNSHNKNPQSQSTPAAIKIARTIKRMD